MVQAISGGWKSISGGWAYELVMGRQAILSWVGRHWHGVRHWHGHGARSSWEWA